MPSTPTGSRLTTYLVLLATLFLWSGNWVIARAVRDDVAPGTATAIRLLLVLAILLPFCAHSLVSKIWRMDKQQLRILFAAGVAGGGLHLSLQWLSLHYTTATSATLYLSTVPVLILLMSRPLLGERIAGRQWSGVAVSFYGVALIGTQGSFSVASFNAGDAMSLFSMVFWGSYTVILRMRRDELDMAEFLTALSMLGLVTLLPWVVFEYFMGLQTNLNAKGFFAVVYSAIGSLLLAGAGWAYVVKRLGAARAGVTMHLMPGITALMAMPILGESPYWYHFAGITLILAGVGLSSTRSSSAASSR